MRDWTRMVEFWVGVASVQEPGSIIRGKLYLMPRSNEVRMTPEQARELAAYILKCADQAEGKSP